MAKLFGYCTSIASLVIFEKLDVSFFTPAETEAGGLGALLATGF